MSFFSLKYSIKNSLRKKSIGFSFFSLNGIKFKDLLKREEYVKDKRWVEELCKDSKMELAMSRAESGCKDFLQQEGSELSYTFVYLIFKDYPM